MSAKDRLESLLLRGVMAGLKRLDWPASLRAGARLGDALRVLGVRRGVALENLRLAFPERAPGECSAILRAHYRELGRIVAEYGRLAELARAPLGEVVAEVRGREHLDAARRAGHGAILLSGHFGHVELMGAFLGQSYPFDFVVRPLRNPLVEGWIARQRLATGVGVISASTGARRILESLKANRMIPMLADQDARRHGVFVPFFGRLASTAGGPARIALAAGAPIIMGFAVRRPDGRHALEFEPPLRLDDPEGVDAVHRLTALHAARLEHWVRRYPENWFWLHRRWKTQPPAGVAAPAVGVRAAATVSESEH